MASLLVALRSTWAAREGHAWNIRHAGLLESGLKQLRVNLAAQLLKERLHLADLHLLQVLAVGQQLRLIG